MNGVFYASGFKGLLAFVIDLTTGDLPNRFHPVAWMGSLIGAGRQRAQRLADRVPQSRRPAVELALGGGIALGGVSLMLSIGSVLQRLLRRLPAPVDWLLEAYLIKTTLALRGLAQAGVEVQAALETGDLPEARRALAWHLVSRDTTQLDETLVAAATIESLAENASDGVIAPLLYAGLGGLPAALAYRFANTADAMLGYHTPTLEWLGKIPARLDDLLNLLPARLTGLLIALAAPLADQRWDWQRTLQALAGMRREARRTESPNAGYPMSAMANGLGVQLEKLGHYRLGDQGHLPTAADIARARRVLCGAAWLGTLLLALLLNRKGAKTAKRAKGF